MKNTFFSILVAVSLLSVGSVGAYYNDNCSPANNYCSGTNYGCNLYCTNGSYNYDYCSQNCTNNSVYNTSYYSYNNYNNYGYNSNGNNFNQYAYTTTNSYANANDSQNNYCYYQNGAAYLCRDSYQNNRTYPQTLQSYWWWTQDDLNLMTQAMNSEGNAPDFFETRILRNDANWQKLNAITMKTYSFRTESMKEKYDDSKKFISALKNAIWQRYTDGTIKNYQMADIIRNLTDTVANLNLNFSYTTQYERTGSSMYDELALDKLTDVKTSYDRLKGSLRWRNW